MIEGFISNRLKLPILVCTGACKKGNGGYIYQKKPGGDEERVVLYFLCSTAKAEREWDARELELLAAIATMGLFQCSLDGQRFTLETDHSNLRWIMNIKNLRGRLARWITRLSAFDVKFVYRESECNEVEGCISRRNSLAAMLARITKQVGAHSAIATVSGHSSSRSAAAADRCAIRGTRACGGGVRACVTTSPFRCLAGAVGDHAVST